jgi:uncharacterized protein (DUF2147 family)
MAVLLLLFAATAVQAQTQTQTQNSPVGLWKTIDDGTGQDKSLVRITSAGGVITGRVEKLLHPSHPNPVCDKCRDDRHDQPITGMQIIAGVRADGEVWDGGKILDPETGKLYTVRLKPIDGGARLEVRGYLGPFFRTQTWIRLE